MRQPQTKFILKVYSITLVLGVALGDIAVYLNDRFQHLQYNSNWDNPFADFIFFFLIGIGESIIPVLIFYVVVWAITKVNTDYNRLLIYMAGLICTVFPFVTLYNMVNEGYHRYNVIIYAVCCFLALTLSYWCANADLNRLIQKNENQNLA
jgi:hypothetical protein